MCSIGKFRYNICVFIAGVLLLFSKTQILANETDHYELVHYSLTSGLSNFNVNSVVRDPWGFVWIGTAYGLNRYDGEIFDTYYKSENGGPCGNHIRSLAIDDDYRMWIGTEEEGICFYDLKTGQFDDLHSLLSEEDLLQIKILSVNRLLYHNENLWIGTNNGLFLLDLTSKRLLNYSGHFSALTNERGSLAVYDLKSAKNGQILIGTSHGIGWIDKGKARFQALSFQDTNASTDKFYVTEILCDINGYHWVATRGGGLLRVRESDLEVTRAHWVADDAIGQGFLQQNLDGEQQRFIVI